MIFGEALRGFVLILFAGYDRPDEHQLMYYGKKCIVVDAVRAQG